MVLCDDCLVEVGHGRHHLNVLRSLDGFTNIALQAMSDAFSVSYISWEAENMSLARKIILLSRQNSSLSATFMHDTRFIDLVNGLMIYAVAFKLEHDVEFMKATKSDISCDMLSSRFILDSSLSTSCPYIRIANLFFKTYNGLRFITDQCKRSCSGNDLDLVHVDDAILFSSKEEDSRLLFMAVGSCINQPTLFTSFHA